MYLFESEIEPRGVTFSNSTDCSLTGLGLKLVFGLNLRDKKDQMDVLFRSMKTHELFLQMINKTVRKR